MSYTNATFCLDQEGGSDAGRTDLAPTAYANNGSGLVRVTHTNSNAAYAPASGCDFVVDIAGTTGSVYVGAWKATIIDSTHIDLQGSAFTVNPATKGTVTPRGGASKTDAWKTITAGPIATRTAPGDTIRVMGSPDPVSLGVNGTWTCATAAQWIAQNIASSTNATPIVITLSGANYTALAPAVGDTVIIGSHATNTKANGVWKVSAVNGSTTVTIVNADGTNSVGNGVGGATGTIRKINKCAVILASNKSVSIACIGNQGTKTNWTSDGGANVVCSVITSTFKEGGECQQIAVGAGFTTGLGAHFATGTLDLSGQTKVSLWIRQSAGTVAVAGDAKFQLCTNTDGTGGVHDIPIPALGALNLWVPVVLDNGAALNAAIKSINFTQLVDRGAQTFQVDCVYAGNLTLQSLIGKNNGVNGETYCAVQSVNNVRVMLEQTPFLSTPNGSYGYYGTSETVPVYYRETIKTTLGASATAQRSGVSGSPITFSGGWDRTNMTTQNLETWFDGTNNTGTGFLFSGVTYVNIDKLNFVRYSVGVYVGNTGTASNCDIGTGVHANNCQTAVALGSTSAGVPVHDITGAIQSASYSDTGLSINSGTPSAMTPANVLNPIYSCNSNTVPISLGRGTTFNTLGNASDETACGNGGPITLGIGALNNTLGKMLVDAGVTAGTQCGLQLGNSGQGASYNTIAYLTATNMPGYGVLANYGSVGNVILGGNTSGNGLGSYATQIGGNTFQGPVNTFFRNFTFNEGAPAAVPSAYLDQRVYVTAYGGDTNDNRQYCDGGTIKSQTTTRHTASGVAWQFSPTSTNRSQYYPLETAIAQIAVVANKLVTVKCWIRRDDTSTLVAKMLCKGAQIAGVLSDVSVTASGSVNTWAKETITFTPTEAGVVEIVGQAYGGTTLNAYFDDMEISQAT